MSLLHWLTCFVTGDDGCEGEDERRGQADRTADALHWYSRRANAEADQLRERRTNGGDIADVMLRARDRVGGAEPT